MKEIYGNQLGQAQTALKRALKSYEGHDEIASVTELLSLMAGVVDPNRGSCSYDSNTDMWVERGFADQPRAKFEWECLDTGTPGVSSFILDSGNQLNMLKFEEVEKMGFKLKDLNKLMAYPGC